MKPNLIAANTHGSGIIWAKEQETGTMMMDLTVLLTRKNRIGYSWTARSIEYFHKVYDIPNRIELPGEFFLP